MTAAEKVRRRSGHRTQWAAQFAVASELCKRDYEVAFTMSNHPSVDIMVSSPTGLDFGIDVKGLYKPNFWAVRAKPDRVGLFYVLAYVPDSAANRYFILSQTDMNAEIDAEIQRARERARLRRGSDEKAAAFPGIPWAVAACHENAWDVLPR